MSELSRSTIQAQQNLERTSLTQKVPKLDHKSQILGKLKQIREIYGDDIYRFVSQMQEAYPHDDPNDTIKEMVEQLGINKDGLKTYWDRHRMSQKIVYPTGKFQCNNLKLLDQGSYTYLIPDDQIIVDENNDCLTFDEFMSLYNAARERGSPFNSPYKSRTTYSSISPKYLRGQDVGPYWTGDKLRKYAEENRLLRATEAEIRRNAEEAQAEAQRAALREAEALRAAEVLRVLEARIAESLRASDARRAETRRVADARRAANETELRSAETQPTTTARRPVAAAAAARPSVRRANWASIWLSSDRGARDAFPHEYNEIRARTGNSNLFTIHSELRDQLEADGRFEAWARNIMATSDDAPTTLPPGRAGVRR